MYKGSVCKVLNNGHLSKPIPLGRGVKEGCPLSPYLFIIAIEILAMKIRSNEKIRGLEFNGINNKVSMYADDSSFMLEPDNTSLQNLIIDLNNFKKISGLKPSYEKCCILRLGHLKGSNYHLPCDLPVECVDGAVNILGIHIPQNIGEISTINYKIKLSKICAILQPWQGKNLTIYGRQH